MKMLLPAIIAFGFCGSQAFAQTQAETTLNAKVESAASQADEAGFSDMVCTNGINTRKVELSSPANESKLPCEVHYKKETEQPGHDQIIWSAENDISFCHAKASAFVDKLTGLGWACSAK